MRRINMLLTLGMLVALGGCGKEATQTTQTDDKAAPTAGPAPGTNTASPTGQATGTADNGTPAANTGTPAAAGAASDEAKNLYQMRCAICHGQSGKGDGPGAASLDPKPRDYSNKEWQASVTDDDLKKIIVGGGTAMGKSPIMPPNPDLGQKPEVLNGLVAMIRSFAQ